jgi:NADH-quinone oxidoreductase subunit G
MPEITINKKKYQVEPGLTIIQACEQLNIEIPRFCYHEKLAIAGNCRMCLVEVVGGPPKPIASCAMPINDGMEIKTDSDMVIKARQGVMEFLLANHPLDCPICDQGGECDLQDQAYQYGKGEGCYNEHKRAVKDKYMGPLIKTHMTRCIHCTRCVRFIEDVAGTCELGAVSRGENMEITTYLEKSVSSELSGNVIDLCPVGALTSKPYSFKARSWELKKTNSIDIMDGVGSNIRIDSRGLEVMRILPNANEDINEEWISDKARFCYDGLKYQRLDKPYIKIDGKLQSSSFEEAYSCISKQFNLLNSDQIALLTGHLSSLEEIFAFKKIWQNANISRFDCRLRNEKLTASDRESYLFNTRISGIEEADFCLLIGVNPKKDAPIVNARIRKRYLSGELKIAAIGCEKDLGYKYQNLGNDSSALIDILQQKSQINQDLKKAKKPMLIVGSDAVNKYNSLDIIKVIKAIADKFNFIQDNWNGFNFLAKESGLINGLALEFTGSHSVKSIIEQCQAGDVKMIILHSVDDEIDFESLKNCFVVYIGSHGDKGAHIADVILPGLTFAEKESSYINIEGKIQKTQKSILGIANLMNDVEIILNLAKYLDIDLGFNDSQELIKNLIKELNLKESSINELDHKWLKDKQSSLNVSGDILAQDYDFYLTNPIARASRILNKCSAENN